MENNELKENFTTEQLGTIFSEIEGKISLDKLVIISFNWEALENVRNLYKFFWFFIININQINIIYIFDLFIVNFTTN